MILFQLGWLGFEVGGREGIRVFDNVAMFLAAAVATIACFAARRGATGRQRTAWGLLGLACLSWTIGQGTWAFYEHVLQRPAPYPSWADAGYLGMIPIAAVALPFFFAREESLRMKTLALIDGLLVGLSFLLFEWAFLLRDIYEATAHSNLERALGLAYPLGDLVLVVMVLHLVLRTEAQQRAAIRFIALGLVGLSVAHLAYARLILEGSYYTGHLLDVGWFGGFLLIAYGAMTNRLGASAPVVARPPMALRRALLPYLPLLLVVLALLGPLVRGAAFDRFIFGTAIVLGGLVFVRQGVMIRENVVLRRSLTEAKERVDRTLAERTMLVNNVAHDLAGALSPIAINLHNLQAPGAGEDGVRRAVAVLKRSSRQLEHLIGDLASLAKLEAGRLQLAKRPTDVGALIRDVTKDFASLSQDKGIQLTTDTPGESWAVADPQRVTQVVYNFVRNAIKFTPKGGEVSVQVRTSGGEVEVRVADNGIGLTREQMERLFQPFSQVHESSNVAEQGTGLGLYISRQLAQAHGGRVWCESDGPRQGAMFAFSLPAAAPP